MVDDNEITISTVFVATKQMIDDLNSDKPKLMMQDTTFKTNVERYKLLKWVFVERLTNKTKVAAFAIILDERKDTFREVISTSAPQYFFLDKDFNQEDVLRHVYEEAGCDIEVLFCLFSTQM